MCVILMNDVSSVHMNHVVFLSAARGVESTKLTVMLCTVLALLTYSSNSVWQESSEAVDAENINEKGSEKHDSPLYCI